MRLISIKVSKWEKIIKPEYTATTTKIAITSNLIHNVLLNGRKSVIILEAKLAKLTKR